MKRLIFLFILLSIASCTTRTIEKNSSIQAKYDAVCARCHDSGLLNAPLAFDPNIWLPRLANGIEPLIEKVKTGVGKMPPGKQLCKNCSTDDFKQLIELMSKPRQ